MRMLLALLTMFLPFVKRNSNSTELYYWCVKQITLMKCLSSLSHRVVSCVGMSSLLNDTDMTPVQKESMNMIVASGDLLLAIVNDVLDYAKLETDHVELNVMPSNLQEMLQSLLYSIEMSAKYKGRSIKATFDPNLPVLVNTDIRRLQQSKFRSRNHNYQLPESQDIETQTLSTFLEVLFNLLGNAIKFSNDKEAVELAVTYDNGHSDQDRFAHLDLSKIEQQLKTQCDAVSIAVKSPQTVSGSRCPFHRVTNQSRDETHIESKTEVALSAVEQDPAANPPSKHSDLFHRQHHNLRFVVTDYGKGIDSADFESIFCPFQQASGTEMNAVYGGTGLGLAITKKLVSALGGTISVASVKGSWTKFTVELPCSDPPAPIQELSQKMSDAIVLICGLPDDEEKNVMDVFNFFSIDARLVKSLDDLAMLLSSRGPDAFAIDRRILCLIRGDRLTARWLRSASEYRMRGNLSVSVFSFGPHATKETNAVTIPIHHIRSMVQMIPQSLIETLHEQSSISPSFTNGNVSNLHSEMREKDLALQNLRVLIAEDNKVNQKVLLRMLGRLGVNFVDVVGNGRDAVDKEESTAYDLILMDQQMPVMGGTQACRLIVDRKQRLHPSPYVFFVTAHVSTNFEMECKEAGSSGFLPKPFKFADIEKCIQNVVKMVIERDARS
jgi:signal transduction histidine kinase